MPPFALPPHVFRAYDIRGIARGAPDDELTPALAERIGRGFATYLRELSDSALHDRRDTAPHDRRDTAPHDRRDTAPYDRRDTAPCVIVGRDSRPTSEELYEAVVAGLRASGAEVTGIGLAPTPVTGWVAAGGAGGAGFDGAVSVTASHNPVEFNGFKLMREQAMPLLPEEIERVRDLVEAGAFASGAGGVVEASPHAAYVDAAAARFQLPAGRRPRVVADPGNGVATLVGPAVLTSMGAEVVGLYTELAEGFPNHVANPQDASTMVDLAARVVAEGADLGVAWDGDGDRVGVVDETGRRYEADWIVALLARDVLRRRPGATILLDMKSSRSAIEDIEAHGGRPVLTRTGYSMFRRQMRDEGIVFGGEASGHIMFGEDYPYLDDGIYAAAALVRMVAERGPLSAQFATMRRLVTSPELGLPCPDGEKAAVAAAVARAFRGRFPVSELDGARIEFGDGWAHVRASNTNPYLSVRFEAETPEGYGKIRELLWETLRSFPCVTIPDGAGEPL